VKACLLGLTLLLCSCVLGPAASSAARPASATGVVLQARDIPDIKKCDQSDRWASLMLSGQPEMLPTGFESWSDLRAGGATDGWLSIYADDASECQLLFGSAPPKGRLVYTAAIKFKDAPSAAASYASGSQGFPVAAYFADRFAAAGGTVTKGASTGFGDNSSVATITFRGVPTWVAYWQKKNFEAVVYADNLPVSEADTVVTRMSTRIR
jgi:hypothetical protein